MIPMGLACPAAILSLFAAAGYILASGKNGLPAILTLGALHALGRFLIDKELATLDADATENLLDHLEKLILVDWSGQMMMTKVARAAVIVETARPTEFAILKDTHAGICQATDLAFLGVGRRNLHHRTPDNFFRSEDGKLDANQRLGF
jgi:hypothetical protein